MESEYRPCVLAVFTNSVGEVLVAERQDVIGQWQFPQGGIDPGEDAKTALYREMGEEIGCSDFDIVSSAAERVRYDFPKDLVRPISKHFRGQEQVWFHVRFHPGSNADLSRATHQEFRALKWVTPAQAIEGVVPFKREAYLFGLKQLGLLKAQN